MRTKNKKSKRQKKARRLGGGGGGGSRRISWGVCVVSVLTGRNKGK